MPLTAKTTITTSPQEFKYYYMTSFRVDSQPNVTKRLRAKLQLMTEEGELHPHVRALSVQSLDAKVQEIRTRTEVEIEEGTPAISTMVGRALDGLASVWNPSTGQPEVDADLLQALQAAVGRGWDPFTGMLEGVYRGVATIAEYEDASIQNLTE